ncbi:MAG: UDP-N-acetylenolpyruvoylglucosamine reductase [Chlamydiae bacterium]|nr:UDP-N-acetylenolpyruvoylglucosamine reductase [Chlamydiota bacterium]
MFEENVEIKSVVHFNIGGLARYFCVVKTIEEMKKAVQFAKDKKVKYFILGKGSNLLFDDLGFCGLVIQNKIKHLHIDKTTVRVGSGYSFAYLGKKLSQMGLSGLEFASGIPGTVGGAVYMNASANVQAVEDVLSACTVLMPDGSIVQKTNQDLSFGYRTSIFQKNEWVILEVTFKLCKMQNAANMQKQLLDKRLSTQPYRAKSAGCCFKNPSQKLSAGQLIEECGLKGFSIGDAIISKKHANFILNKNNASSKDVKKLIETVQKKVKAKKGVDLELEIEVIDHV